MPSARVMEADQHHQQHQCQQDHACMHCEICQAPTIVLVSFSVLLGAWHAFNRLVHSSSASSLSIYHCGAMHEGSI